MFVEKAYLVFVEKAYLVHECEISSFRCFFDIFCEYGGVLNIYGHSRCKWFKMVGKYIWSREFLPPFNKNKVLFQVEWVVIASPVHYPQNIALIRVDKLNLHHSYVHLNKSFEF